MAVTNPAAQGSAASSSTAMPYSSQIATTCSIRSGMPKVGIGTQAEMRRPSLRLQAWPSRSSACSDGLRRSVLPKTQRVEIHIREHGMGTHVAERIAGGDEVQHPGITSWPRSTLASYYTAIRTAAKSRFVKVPNEIHL